MKKQILTLTTYFSIHAITCAGFNISDLTWVDDVGARTEPTKNGMFNVASFAAISDGSTINTKAIQATIDACHNAGGGIVTFSSGNYLTGSIYLKEGVHLIIPEGVTLLDSQKIEDYPEIPTRVAGIEMIWPSALINVIGHKNIKISGKGTVDGQGKPFWDAYWSLRKEYEAKGTTFGIRFKSARNRGGTTQHIYLKNIEMEEVGTAIEANMNWHPTYSYPTLPEEFKNVELPDHWNKMLQIVDPEKATPYFNNIHLSNINVSHVRSAINVRGSDVSKMENLYLNNITIHAEKAGTIKHASNWTTANISISSTDNLPTQIIECKNVSLTSD
jgi:hypothetical protein